MVPQQRWELWIHQHGKEVKDFSIEGGNRSQVATGGSQLGPASSCVTRKLALGCEKEAEVPLLIRVTAVPPLILRERKDSG